LPRASKALDAKPVGKKAATGARTPPSAGGVTNTGTAVPTTGNQPPPAEAARAAEAEKAPVPAKQAAPRKRAAAKKAPAARAARRAKTAPEGAPAEALSDKFLLEQEVLLDAERDTYQTQAAALKAQADQLAQEMEPGDIQFDDESGEGGTANVDRERDLALSAQARVAVDEIDHARQKISSGTYGVCEGCGQPIPRARLKALPHARLCVSCKSGGLSRR
jgi:DnaK suppressor protein